MSTIQPIISSETITGVSLPKINANFTALNADKLEASDIVGKQDTLVSGTNIKTINGVTVLGSGNVAIPALTDGDKGDIVVSSSGTVWTVDNDTITNAKLANVASGTFKGRTTVGSGDPEDMTATQATALLDLATTSNKGLLSPADKTKLDATTSFIFVGTYTGISVSTSSDGIETSSSTGILTKSGIATFGWTVPNNTNVKLQYSSDNVNFSDFITIPASSQTGSNTILVGQGYAYRIQVQRTFGSFTVSGSLTYLV